MTATTVPQAVDQPVVPTPRISVPRVAPTQFAAMLGLEESIHLDPVIKELVKLRASILNGCAYCVDMHSRDAREAGEDERRLATVAAWHESPFFTARERAALALTDSVTRLGPEGVADDVWAGATAVFDDEELGNLVWAIAAINVWNRIAVTARSLPDDVARARRAAARAQAQA